MIQLSCCEIRPRSTLWGGDGRPLPQQACCGEADGNSESSSKEKATSAWTSGVRLLPSTTEPFDNYCLSVSTERVSQSVSLLLCPLAGIVSCVRRCLKRTAGHLEPTSSVCRWGWLLSWWVWRGMVSPCITQRNMGGATWYLDAGITWCLRRRVQGPCAHTGTYTLCLHHQDTTYLLFNVILQHRMYVYLFKHLFCLTELLSVFTESTVSRTAKSSQNIWTAGLQMISCGQTAQCGKRCIRSECNVPHSCSVYKKASINLTVYKSYERDHTS